MLSVSRRRKWAPLLLVAAGLGAYAMVGPKMPHARQVVLDLGPDAADLTDLELTWTRAGTMDDAALTTRWHFALGAAPRRLPFEARLADGAWDVDVTLERQSRETTRWPYRVNLEPTPFWTRDPRGELPEVIPVREALR
ncbi:MAG TPA: hypothetical protein VK550_05050 [Polyangiaceae bacterium]|nr:hypothetical protein [Polyangiaceae bacterium]